MFSLKNLSKMSVLNVLDSKHVIKRVHNHDFCSTSCIFSENPCARMQKTQKIEKKNICFTVANFHMNLKTITVNIFTIKTNAFLHFFRFMHFRTRILTKNATCWSENAIKPMVFKQFGAKTE